MKYEMIFGDEGLFFDAQKDCEMVGNGHHKVENGKLMVWNFSEKYWAESHTNKITIAAMRRIIKEPKRWTWEDKKAGVLPEVGAECIKEGKVVTILNVNERYVAYIDKNNSRANSENVSINSVNSFFKPIETQEDRAKRFRKEWCNKALSSCSILSGMQKYELKRLGGYIEDIYDALLSGDLSTPVQAKDGE